MIFSNRDSICKDDVLTFNTLINNSSGNLQYKWYRNAPFINGATGSKFSSSQLNDGDIISCEMIDLNKCSSPFTDQSNDIKVKVLPWLAPQVSITVTPTLPVHEDSLIEFQAIASDAGLQPDYQWYKNSNKILGATSDFWSSNNLSDNDSINVKVYSKYYCPKPDTSSSNTVVVKILSSVKNNEYNLNDIRLYPNPNNGEFYIDLNTHANRAAKGHITLIDVTGKTYIEKEIDFSFSRSLNKITLPYISEGIYMLNVIVENSVIYRSKVLIQR